MPFNTQDAVLTSNGCVLFVPDAESGRRIYIHIVTLVGLASSSTLMADDTFSALADIAVRRAALNLLGDFNVSLGLSDLVVVEAIEQEFSFARVTDVLRQAHFTDRRGLPGHYDAVAVLRSDEAIIASCFESGYFTFATTIPASDRMYADNVSLGVLRQQLDRGEAAVADLTLLKGATLHPTDTGHPSLDALATASILHTRFESAKERLSYILDASKAELGRGASGSVAETVARTLSRLAAELLGAAGS